MSKRGIIAWDPMGKEDVRPNFVAHEGFEVFRNPSVAPTVPIMDVSPNQKTLRMWALFWDEIQFPVWDDAMIATDSSFLRLHDEGIASFFPISRSDANDFLATRPHTLDQRTAFIQLCVKAELEKEEPGQWCIELQSGINFPPDSVADGTRDVLVRLYDAIPVPAVQESWKKILEFRRQRRDELVALRIHLEDVYQKIISAGDGPLAFDTEKERLERAIRDYLAAMNERRFRISWANLEARIKWEFTPSIPMIGFAVGYMLGGPAGAAIGSVSSALAPKIEISTAASVKGLQPRMSPFAYIGSIHNNFSKRPSKRSAK